MVDGCQIPHRYALATNQSSIGVDPTSPRKRTVKIRFRSSARPRHQRASAGTADFSLQWNHWNGKESLGSNRIMGVGGGGIHSRRVLRQKTTMKISMVTSTSKLSRLSEPSVGWFGRVHLRYRLSNQ